MHSFLVLGKTNTLYCSLVGKYRGTGSVFVAAINQPASQLVASSVQDRKPKTANFSEFLRARRHSLVPDNHLSYAVVELETAVSASGWRWGNALSLLNAGVGLATALVGDTFVFKQS